MQGVLSLWLKRHIAMGSDFKGNDHGLKSVLTLWGLSAFLPLEVIQYLHDIKMWGAGSYRQFCFSFKHHFEEKW